LDLLKAWDGPLPQGQSKAERKARKRIGERLLHATALLGEEADGAEEDASEDASESDESSSASLDSEDVSVSVSIW
jgi:U3 small nucleolar RNA-associated protein 14